MPKETLDQHPKAANCRKKDREKTARGIPDAVVGRPGSTEATLNADSNK